MRVVATGVALTLTAWFSSSNADGIPKPCPIDCGAPHGKLAIYAIVPQGAQNEAFYSGFFSDNTPASEEMPIFLSYKGREQLEFIVNLLADRTDTAGVAVFGVNAGSLLNSLGPEDDRAALINDFPIIADSDSTFSGVSIGDGGLLTIKHGEYARTLMDQWWGSKKYFLSQ